MKKYRILNLYAGIGGNRKLWGDEYEITSVEIDPKIAEIYKSYFPNDTVIVADAHQYLLEHFKEFDFIWSSPPCQTHSVTNNFLHAQGHVRYPEMSLYQEIIFLQHFFKGKYVVENVKPYYQPLIKPQISGRHYFWSNFKIPNIKQTYCTIGAMKGTKRHEGANHHKLGFDISKIKGVDKHQVLNNCVSPEIGLAILNKARNIQKEETIPQGQLFVNTH